MAELKKCPDCGTEMKLEKRAKPEGGAMFMSDDMWVCSKCHRSINAEVEKESH